MPLLYSLVSREVNVLAEYQLDNLTGNFSTISRVLLRKVSPSLDEQKSFQHDNFAFHYRQSHQLIYLVMADKSTRPSRAFAFLDEIERRFLHQYGQRANTAVAFAFNADFSRILKAEMERFNEVASDDKFSEIRTNLQDVKEQMVDNLDQVIQRGEKIDLLVDKSEELEVHAIRFNKSSRQLKWYMCRQNVKWTMVAILVVVLIILGLVMGFCGANFSKCKK